MYQHERCGGVAPTREYLTGPTSCRASLADVPLLTPQQLLTAVEGANITMSGPAPGADLQHIVSAGALRCLAVPCHIYMALAAAGQASLGAS